jgi:hypothetical protein
VSPSAIRSHIPQTLDIVTKFPPQVVLNGHLGQFIGESEHLGRGQGSDLRSLVDRELRAESGGNVRTDSVEGLEGGLFNDTLEWSDSVGRPWWRWGTWSTRDSGMLIPRIKTILLSARV